MALKPAVSRKGATGASVSGRTGPGTAPSSTCWGRYSARVLKVHWPYTQSGSVGCLSFARCGSTAVGPLFTAPVARGLVERGSAHLSVVSHSVALRLRKRGGGRLLGTRWPAAGNYLLGVRCESRSPRPGCRGRTLAVSWRFPKWGAARPPCRTQTSRVLRAPTKGPGGQLASGMAQNSARPGTALNSAGKRLG
jgi:hypothetical protein